MAIAAANGDLSALANATWSPLFPLLQSLIISLGFEPLLSAKILQIILGLSFIYLSIKTLELLGVNPFIKGVAKTSLTFLALFFSFYSINADLLITVILTLYLNIVLSHLKSFNHKFGILIGIIGGIAYLARFYALPFFFIHLTLISVLLVTKSQSHKDKILHLKNYFLGLSIFLTIAFSWIAILSFKYGSLTAGVNTIYDFRSLSPSYENYPLYSLGLINPPSNQSISIWDDLFSFANRLEPWNPLSSQNNLTHFTSLIIKNFISILKVYSEFFILPLLIIMYFLFRKTKFSTKKHIVLILLSTSILFSLGYLPFNFVERHLWFSVVSFFFFIIYLLSNIPIKSLFIKILIALSILAISIRPILFLKDGVTRRDYYFFISEKIYSDSKNLQSQKVAGRFASNSNWPETLYYAYFLKSKYLGISHKPIDLFIFNVDYYFLWKDGKEITLEGNVWEKIFEDEYLVILEHKNHH